ncbi:MAG: type II toxin-antitoxin system RelE family toxin [Pyrinomonadaceae bacterium]
MRIIYSDAFLRSAAKLPTNQQRKLDQLLSVCSENPFDSRLHTKRLVGQLHGFLSFRITRDWRALFQFIDPETIQLLRVAHRRDIYR